MFKTFIVCTVAVVVLAASATGSAARGGRD